MNNGNSEYLIETDWLMQNLQNPDISIIDATWYLPGTPEDPCQQYQTSRIPGAVFFNIDEIANKETDLPHMLPTEEAFSSAVSDMNINNSDHVIIYDRLGIFSAPRVWWTFRAMGHNKVSILNGGLKKWLAEGQPVSTTPPATKTAQSSYKGVLNTNLVKSFEQVQKMIASGQSNQIIDARPAPRFNGQAEEPRPGLKKGHMPGSVNLPFAELLTKDGLLKSTDDLESIFNNLKIPLDQPLITTCGSGVTAAVLSFALAVLGYENTAVYDGSWAEWGAHTDALVI